MRDVGTKKNLYKNAWMLMVLQLANYIFPLLLIPFLARKLGLIHYGNLAFCLGIVQMAAVITDYGFGLSVTYKISKWRHRQKYIEKLMRAVYVCKISLVVVVCVLLLIYGFFQKEPELRTLLLISIFPIATQAIAPVWLFQGIERMPSFVVFMLVSRFFYLIPCLMLIDGQSDGWIAILALGWANLLAGLFGLRLAQRYGYGASPWPGLRFTLAVFKNSTSFFISRAAVSVYTTFGVVFLGMFAHPSQVSIYSAAEQLTRAVQGLIGMGAQALYPYMARTKDYHLLFRLVKILSVCALVGVAIGYAFGEPVIALIFGENFVASFDVLKVFLWVLLITVPSVLLGYPLLGALGRLDLANKSVLLAGGAQTILLLGLCFSGVVNAVSVACCVLVAEALVLICRLYWARKFVEPNKVNR